jgi:hypothetical protein
MSGETSPARQAATRAADATMSRGLRWVAIVMVSLVGVFGLVLAVSGAVGFLSSAQHANQPDFASLAVAGATLLLTAVTGTLALLTWESLAATRQGARNTEAALGLEREQAQIARDALRASSRPLLIEPSAATAFANRALEYTRITIDASLSQTAVFAIAWVNMGPGAAVVTKALFGMGTVAFPADKVTPRIVPPGAIVLSTFTLVPEHSDQIVRAVQDVGGGYDFKTSVEYHDLGAARAWRSVCRLERDGRSKSFKQIDLLVTDIPID